jgi:selenocysteine lyase/cysteine desulfurase
MVTHCQREQFSLPEGVHYLNCAYMAPLARGVEEAGRRALAEIRDPSGVADDFYFGRVDRARKLYATLIGVEDWDRVAVVPSCSYALGIAAANSRAKQGQNIVVIGDEFPSAVLPWHRLAFERRVVVRTIGAPTGVAPQDRAGAWSGRIIERIDDCTAVVVLAPVHWCDGTRFDLEAIAAAAHEVGADVIVDGTQSLGAMPFAFDAVRPDAIVCAGYKWLLGGYGMALAYLGAKYDGGIPLEENWTSQVGSDDFASLAEYQHAYRSRSGRYDGGQRANPVVLSMLEASLTQLLEWGPDAIQCYCEGLVVRLRERAEELGLVVDTSRDRCSHIVGVRFADGRDAKRVGLALGARGVRVSVRGDAIRVAPNVYNDAADIEALIEGLASTCV